MKIKESPIGQGRGIVRRYQTANIGAYYTPLEIAEFTAGSSSFLKNAMDAIISNTITSNPPFDSKENVSK